MNDQCLVNEFPRSRIAYEFPTFSSLESQKKKMAWILPEEIPNEKFSLGSHLSVALKTGSS